MKIIENVDCLEMAEVFYSACTDMDFCDYEEEKETTIKELEEFFYHLKAIAENEYNHNYFRTGWNCLQTIANLDL